MHVDYTEDHLHYKQAVESYVAKQIRPLADEFDFDAPLSGEQVRELLRRMKGGIADEVPMTEEGEIDWIAIGILLENMASVSGSLAFLVIEALTFPASLQPLLSDAQRARYAPLFEPGKHLASAFSEPGAGSNPAQMLTTARRDGDGWVISGTKLWSSGAGHADGLFVAAQVQDGDKRPGIGMFLLDRRVTPYATSDVSMMGLRSHALSEIVLDEIRVPLDAQIGADGEGPRILGLMLQRARCTMGMIAVGIAQRALDLSVAYAGQRTQFGKPIAGFQLVQQMLADMATNVTLGRLISFRALTILQRGGLATLESSMAKSWCTEMAARVTSTGVQVHGALGLSRESEIERLFRDARMLTIPDGTTQIQTLVIGRELTGIAAFR